MNYKALKCGALETFQDDLKHWVGGAYRDRTGDLNAASVALSQLS